MARSPSFSRIVSFGDSLVDTGAVFDLTSRTLFAPVPTPGFAYAGRFSNGPVQIEVATGLLGVALENYAVGGAQALGSLTLSDFLTSSGAPLGVILPGAAPEDLAFDFNLSAQVDRYAATLGASGAAPGTAASFLIGLNDISNIFETGAPPSDPFAFVAGLAGATLGAAAEVVTYGVDTVILYTLPDPTFFPSSQFVPPEGLAGGALITGGYNALLRAGGAVLEATTGADVVIVEFGAMAGEIEADPTAFGLTAPFAQPKYFSFGSPTLDPNVSPVPFYVENPAVADRPLDQVAFIDFVHPSAATHGVLGSFVAASLSSDVRILGDGDDLAFGGFHEDLMLGGAGDDTLLLLTGDDIALGGLGDDRIYAGFGDDIAAGGSGDDRIDGGFGDDLVAGGDGDDDLRGGFGRDLLIDGMGSDIARGGFGADAFLYVEAAVFGVADQSDEDLFIGGAGFDTVYLALTAGVQASVESEIASGGVNQSFDAIGLTTFGMERIAFLADPDDLADVALAARVEEGALWGFV